MTFLSRGWNNLLSFFCPFRGATTTIIAVTIMISTDGKIKYKKRDTGPYKLRV